MKQQLVVMSFYLISLFIRTSLRRAGEWLRHSVSWCEEENAMSEEASEAASPSASGAEGL